MGHSATRPPALGRAGSRRVPPLLLALVALGALLLPVGTAVARERPGHADHAGKAQRADHAGKAQRGKAPSAQRPAYWGAWIGDQITGAAPPWDMEPVNALGGLLGKGMSMVEFSSPFADCHETPCSFYEFPTGEMGAIRAYGAIPFLSWSTASWPYDEVNITDPGFQLRDIIDGGYDAYIRQFAAQAAAWGYPFFLRFDWEMNGRWFPWSEGANGNLPGEYVAAWRHVHDIFTQVGATNATWVWCPYPQPQPRPRNLARLYPGSRFVDWTCLDAFNWAKNPANPQRWRSFAQIVDGSYKLITSKIAPKKPMLLAEMASTGSGRAKARWINRMFRAVAQRYRRIRGLIWFDKVDREVQWPLEQSPAALKAFARGVSSRAFQGARYSELPAGPVPRPTRK